jgi:ribosome-binding protein aMBF1 (putative translation factor)
MKRSKFGLFCVGRRRETGRNLGMMAAAIGFDEDYICSIESGDIQPPDCYIEEVAQYFGLKLEYIYQMLKDANQIKPASEMGKSLEGGDVGAKILSLADHKAKRWQKTSIPTTD